MIKRIRKMKYVPLSADNLLSPSTGRHPLQCFQAQMFCAQGVDNTVHGMCALQFTPHCSQTARGIAFLQVFVFSSFRPVSYHETGIRLPKPVTTSFWPVATCYCVTGVMTTGAVDRGSSNSLGHAHSYYLCITSKTCGGVLVRGQTASPPCAFLSERTTLLKQGSSVRYYYCIRRYIARYKRCTLRVLSHLPHPQPSCS